MKFLSFFKRKQTAVTGYYTIMIPESVGFSTRSGGFRALNYNEDTFTAEILAHIRKTHNVSNFTIIMLVFYPPNTGNQPPDARHPAAPTAESRTLHDAERPIVETTKRADAQEKT